MAGPAWISKVSAGQARMWLAGVLGAGRGLARGPRWGGDGARLAGNSQGAGPSRPCAWLGGPQAVCRQPRARKVAPGAGTASRSRRGAPVLFPTRPQCHRRHLSRPEPRPRAELGNVTGATGQAPPSRLFPKLRPCSLLIAHRVRLSTTRAFPGLYSGPGRVTSLATGTCFGLERFSQVRESRGHFPARFFSPLECFLVCSCSYFPFKGHGARCTLEPEHPETGRGRPQRLSFTLCG